MFNEVLLTLWPLLFPRRSCALQPFQVLAGFQPKNMYILSLCTRKIKNLTVAKATESLCIPLLLAVGFKAPALFYKEVSKLR
jgi:hypothetical protein